MRRRVVLFSVAAVAVVALLAAGLAITAFALVSDSPAQADTVEVAPVQAEQVSQPQVEKPVLRYEHAGYAGRTGGCSYKAKLQMTEAPAEKVEDQLLTQAIY